jgi:hypothetical protein
LCQRLGSFAVLRASKSGKSPNQHTQIEVVAPDLLKTEANLYEKKQPNPYAA